MKEIAIVGIGGVFPTATEYTEPQTSNHLDKFWQDIYAARDCSREIPAHRWLLPPRALWSDKTSTDKVNSIRACLLDLPHLESDGLQLDERFLATLDPMFHVLLQAGQQAWQDAHTDTLDKQRVGVIIGNIVLPSDASSHLAEELLGPAFETQLLQAQHSDRSLTANDDGTDKTEPLNKYVAGLPAGVMAKALGLGGGSYTLDAACASSLYALKYAVDELIADRADAMLTGGLSRPDCLYTQMGFSALGAISKSGRCAPFDHKADGLVVGEGAGILVLKRLADAIRDKDHIYATIAGIGLSNDTGGNLMSPDSEGQLRAMWAAYQQADWSPQDVDLIECHGTGTPIGDTVEYQSLRQLWSAVPASESCVIGSVKSNIGHLLTAAGAASLIKILLAIKHQQLPPTANFEAAADNIDLENSPFKILNQPQNWSPRNPHTPRRAAISAFGFGGTNAHVLLQEWRAGTSPATVVSQQNDTPAIAIVGMETQLGPWRSLSAFRRRLFGKQQDKPSLPDHWWGVANSDQIKGWFIEHVKVPMGRYRIPPTELQEMLPQQLLMLEAAANAIADADIEQLLKQQSDRTGVFIGIGLDFNTTNFHFRWSLLNKAQLWVQQLGLDLDQQQLQEWITSLQDAASPPLNAHRTMGALGGIVASRIARVFGIGGPGFTVSGEESSGLWALEKGIRALQAGELDIAIIGAVDLAGDVRAVLAQHAIRAYSEHTLVGEGAVALVLRRHRDACRDGNRIYAVVKSIAAAQGGGVDDIVPTKHAYRRSFNKACREAGINADRLSLIETHGSGHQQEDSMEIQALRSLFSDHKRAENKPPIVLSNVKSMIGHSGAAGGLAAVASVSISLYHRLLPATRQRPLFEHIKPLTTLQHSQYWLRDKMDGARLAAVSTFSIDGNCLHAILEEADMVAISAPDDMALFAFYASSKEQLLHNLGQLKSQSDKYRTISALASDWWRSTAAHRSTPQFTAAIVTNHEQLHQTAQALQQAIMQNKAVSSDGIYFSPVPLVDQEKGAQGKLAFVYPGSGNHFSGMGRDLSCQWPQILEHLDSENDALGSQFSGGLFWQAAGDYQYIYKQTIFGQVWLGTLVTDVISQFKVRADAIIGYSLGETAGLFATRTWTARDEMMRRIRDSDLFTEALAGSCYAVRDNWGLSDTETVDWLTGVISCPAHRVQQKLTADPNSYRRVYLLIINTDQECVIGGDRDTVLKLVTDLNGYFSPIANVIAVHCEVVAAISERYRDLHVFDTTPPADLIFYSGAWGKAYLVNSGSAADSIVDQAITTVDYTRVIKAAYADGVRYFIEIGPGASCTRMITNILSDRPHIARAICSDRQDNNIELLHCLAHLIAEHIPADLSCMYQSEQVQRQEPSQYITVDIGARCFDVSPLRHSDKNDNQVTNSDKQLVSDQQSILPTLIAQMQATESAKMAAQETFLTVSHDITAMMTQALNIQISLHRDKYGGIKRELTGLSGNLAQENLLPAHAPLPQLPIDHTATQISKQSTSSIQLDKQVLFDRDQCMQIATGSIAALLGEQFSDIDHYPSRVRLPDEPLMLVDRIVEINGRADSLQDDPAATGNLITEHDILPTAWYLDSGRIPTCIAVEAGQADLFLSGYLGIDHITKGLAFYRLLDAKITFHDALPGTGATIRYHIHITQFFQQDQTWLFRFNFEGTVNGRPLLTMTDGCAGFFTAAQLAAGQGIVQTAMEKQQQPGIIPPHWPPLVMDNESYNDQQINALRQGDLAACFGDQFGQLRLRQAIGLAGGRMALVHRIVNLDPQGGRFGIGEITGEADIRPDDWFLICHFCDDQVMPGTLIYECCMHTLRVYLLRMGWVGEHDEIIYQPVIGITSQLKCRGQVTAATDQVQYQITLKEIGYQPDGTPYVLADALIFADGKAIVQINNMSVRLSGLSEDKIRHCWQSSDASTAEQSALFDYDSIHAFATGKPSVAFGDRYKVFDEERRIARLPRPPYQLLDRIISIENCQQWQLQAGGTIEAQYDIPPDAWYFEHNRQLYMPFAILLEIALQPCGWLAAYLGSALTSDTDLSFRNLGGQGRQFKMVTAQTGTLTSRIEITKVSQSGSMIIQHYNMQLRSDSDIVYKGDTYFGFFSALSLADQVGIRGAQPYQPDQQPLQRGMSFPYPDIAPYPKNMMRMIDEISLIDKQGGPQKLGFIRGTTRVNPEAWFFKAHFYQDPVCPGSLGLESFLQLLKIFAVEIWGQQDKLQHYTFETPVLEQLHQWTYRGQIIPVDQQITVEAVITEINHQTKLLRADGFLTIDNRIIYQMSDFTLRIQI